MDLSKIIEELKLKKLRLDRIILELEGLMTDRGIVPPPEGIKKSGRGRKSMPPQERKEVSERMKRYWAKRRKDQ